MVAAEMKVTALELCLRRLGWDKELPVQDLEDSIATALKGLAHFKKFPPRIWTPGSGRGYNEQDLARQVEKAIGDLRAVADPNGTPAKDIGLQRLVFAFLDNGVSLEYLRPLLGLPERTPKPDIEDIEILVNYLPDGIHKRFQFGSTLYPDQPSNRQTDASFLLSPFESYKSALGPPSILVVCRESRGFALEHYQLAFTSNTLFGTYFNFEIDTLYLRCHQIYGYNYQPNNSRRLTWVANFLHRPTLSVPLTLAATEDVERVKYLAVEVDPHNIGPSFGVKHSWQQVEFSTDVASLLRIVPNTEKITVLVHSIGKKSQHPQFVDPINFDKALSHYKKSLASIVDDPKDLGLGVTAFGVKEEEIRSHLDEEGVKKRIDRELPEIEYKFGIDVDHQEKLNTLIKVCKARMVNCKWTLERKVAKLTT